MLLGTYAPKLDEKGRVILPAKFRDELSDGIVMTRGQERCVVVFSQQEFAALHDRIRQAPMTNKRTRDYMRLFLSGASAEQPDKQNRVTIPQNLREYAGLERDLTVIGAGDRAEIWSTPAWEAYYAASEADFAENDEEVIPGVF
ncbi:MULTISPECIES: division/cell wall cluster transcriptional repressor MraZ [unclassified Curtobacterium]|uniref:division/cell wall cluster transcriptional repressor MraZ n=1 Tax=unclassified Curtobacterium TaxID=257496 RepID=UPI000DA9EE43|nr:MULTISPECIES: division/cell wall cluster transcriptional repressor MraZ [unclassified Curtobacterium]PZE29997.1 cell division/cell wall cluster transcriptional repressor MraZ [Curtobacterium sp. MCBD17_028]PZE74545.1 cell division/cell wall cluster transcriptional repressor MraZ [Curtobacterium sp. MCBD17_019]PZF61048.1 cell division/cell wall cluster transcriptional repressor MraZ [Curtobacterium sp. MCBD17_034]PZF66222.1 cell division/cell wall cluster transcriptional repressor MraZ [Curto